jgi:DNA-binding transcriptional MerR regulator
MSLAKGPEAFRSISEAADELGVPQHVLRFWETRFSFIRPMKRAGGRRFYRPQDLAVLRGVRTLLHDKGYTIKGVQRLHREQGVKRLAMACAEDGAGAPDLDFDSESMEAQSADRARLETMLESLEAAKNRLDALLARSGR